ncbi:hypothetical protein B0H13DRAFT_1942690 [Mycena leptocephala]|nr:hypothetical protein B0H13DRAFT_1942690 [Mycena leptocephala]
MFFSPGEIIGGIAFLVGVAEKVRSEENKEELQRLAKRLQYVMTALAESRERNELQPTEYEDALSVISSLVERSHRVTQRILKRSLGDRTWRRDDIALEIKRITADVDTYLNVHVLTELFSTNTQAFTTLFSSVEEIMVKLAEIDMRMQTPNAGDSRWSPSSECAHVPQNIRPTSYMPCSDLQPHDQQRPHEQRPTTNKSVSPNLRIGHQLASSSHTSVQVSYLKTPDGHVFDDPVTIPNVNIGSSYQDVLEAIRMAGYLVPADLTGEAVMMNLADVDQFDAMMPGGLKISRDTPLILWWSKYREFHGIASGTTPGHTLAELADPNAQGGTTAVLAGGVKIRFHRTLRVPENLDVNRLPVDLGSFPLLPVAKFAHRLPEKITSRGGFFMPMFEREALFISFETKQSRKTPAVKVSAGGVNVLTGIFKNVPDDQVREQDYIVPGLQLWIDGAMTEEGVVRQFVAMSHGGNYTIEEQVTGKAEEGGFQFDIFPRRIEPEASFYEFNMRFETSRGRSKQGRYLELLKTPGELGVPNGAVIGMHDSRHWPVRSEHNWTVGAYQRRIGNFPLVATYEHTGIGGMYVAGYPPKPIIRTLEAAQRTNSKVVAPMGIGLGGKMQVSSSRSQKIYKDELSPRAYDEENGHRFHVHILAADVWELSDTTVTAIAPKTDILGKIKAIAEIDREKLAAEKAQALPAPETLIDPDRPPSCSLHLTFSLRSFSGPRVPGKAMLKRSKCPCCSKQISTFVGMKEPVAGFDQEEIGDTEVDNSEATWNVKLAEIEQGEVLATQAVTQGKVVVIHLEKDRVAPLYSKDGTPPKKSSQAPAALAPTQSPGVSSKRSVLSFVPSRSIA